MDFSALPWWAVITSLFTVPLLFGAAVQFVRRPLWSRAALLLAMLFQGTGFGALSYFSYHETDHAAYLVAFICTTLAPCLLAAVFFMTFHRLQASAVPCGARLHIVAPAIGLIQGVVLCCLLVGFYYLALFHSPMPIRSPADALVRLGYETSSLEYFYVAYNGELASLGLLLFGLVVLALRGTEVGAKTPRNRNRLFSSLCAVTGLMFVSSHDPLQMVSAKMLTACQIGAAWKTVCIYSQGSESLNLLSGNDNFAAFSPFLLSKCFTFPFVVGIVANETAQ